MFFGKVDEIEKCDCKYVHDNIHQESFEQIHRQLEECEKCVYKKRVEEQKK